MNAIVPAFVALVVSAWPLSPVGAEVDGPAVRSTVATKSGARVRADDRPSHPPGGWAPDPPGSRLAPPTYAERGLLAEFGRQQAERQAREAWQRRQEMLALLVMAVSAVIGLLLAWRVGRATPPTRGWPYLGAGYLAISLIALVAFLAISDPANLGWFIVLGAAVHLHWAALLSLIVYRRWIKKALQTERGRLCVSVWILWAGWFGLDLHESSVREDDIPKFTFGGQLFPIALALAVRWAAHGSPRAKPSM